MELLTVLEFVGMVSTMTGAYLVSRNKEMLMFYGATAFLTANYTMFAFATGKGMIPLQIQMVFFFMATIPMLKAYSPNWELSKKIILIFTPIYTILLISFIDINLGNIEITRFEIIAAIIAVSGSFLLKYKNSDIKIIAFILFFVADVIYVYVSIDKSLIFFGIQSLFFWYTSIDGIKGELNGKSFKSWITGQKERLISI